jgi:hippurate hydrolase
VLALQALVTRRVDAFDPVVLTITRIRAGTTNNVIPAGAQLLGTIRSVSEKARRRVHDGVRRVVGGIASAHEVEAKVHILEGYPVTVNDGTCAEFTLEVARELLGEGRAIPMPSPIMGAEDFSYLLQRVPGAMTFLGVRPDGAAPVPLHSNRMVLEESALASGIALHASLALRWLERAGARAG